MGPFGYISPAGGTGAASEVQPGAVKSGDLSAGAVQPADIRLLSGWPELTEGEAASRLPAYDVTNDENRVITMTALASTVGNMSGAVRSGGVASGQLGRFHMASGCTIDLFPCEQAISGVRAVAWGSGGCFVVPAERQSGLRLPAIGVVAGNFSSGAVVPVVTGGVVTTTASGAIASGHFGRYLYVGSGGLIVNLSGFMGGASSGAPTLSGSLVQRIGVAVSGGVYVIPGGDLTSGLFSGLLINY